MALFKNPIPIEPPSRVDGFLSWLALRWKIIAAAILAALVGGGVVTGKGAAVLNAVGNVVLTAPGPDSVIGVQAPPEPTAAPSTRDAGR